MQIKYLNRLLRMALILAATAICAGAGGPARAGESPSTGSGPLRVGLAPSSPPMIFKQGKEIVGVEPDLAQALGKELGRSIRFVETPWEDLIDALEANKIDIVMSSMSITRARLTRVAFADPYLRIGQMALVRAEEKFRYAPLGNSLGSQTVGVKKATTADLLVQQEFPRAKRKYFETGESAAQALRKKKIDLYFSDSTMIWYLAGKYEADGLVAAPTIFTDETLGWAIRRSDGDLLESVNKALKNLRTTGELDKILHRWIPRFQ